MVVIALMASVVILLVLVLYLLGLRLGSDASRDELLEVRLAAHRAERELTDLTRQAFATMAEHALHDREARRHKR